MNPICNPQPHFPIAVCRAEPGDDDEPEDGGDPAAATAAGQYPPRGRVAGPSAACPPAAAAVRAAPLSPPRGDTAERGTASSEPKGRGVLAGEGQGCSGCSTVGVVEGCVLLSRRSFVAQEYLCWFEKNFI